MNVITLPRLERASRARELRDRGMLLREIAAEMGVAIATVSSWLDDPDGSKLRARKDSYRGKCEACGGPTNGSNGRDRAPKTCRGCQIEAQTVWSRESIIAAIRAWARLYGSPPALTDWHTYLRRRTKDAVEREARWLGGTYPDKETVRLWFGSWNAAVAAAGFTPRRRGRPRRRAVVNASELNPAGPAPDCAV